jgi:hypothetical protein
MCKRGCSECVAFVDSAGRVLFGLVAHLLQRMRMTPTGGGGWRAHWNHVTHCTTPIMSAAKQRGRRVEFPAASTIHGVPRSRGDSPTGPWTEPVCPTPARCHAHAVMPTWTECVCSLAAWDMTPRCTGQQWARGTCGPRIAPLRTHSRRARASARPRRGRAAASPGAGACWRGWPR